MRIFIGKGEPNHCCPNCGRTFLNNKDSQCYGCGEHDALRGDEADLDDPFDYDGYQSFNTYEDWSE